MQAPEYPTCQQCDGDLGTGKKFCSRECWRAFTAELAAASRKLCERCGEPVKTRGAAVRYCSPDCARLASRGRTLPDDVRARIAESNRRTKAAQRKAPASCVECGKEGGDRSRGMCRTCYARWRYAQKTPEERTRRYHENREAGLEDRRRWRERNPDYFKTDEIRQRATARYQEAYFGGLRPAVVKRDDSTCQDCGERCVRKHSLHVHHVDGVKTNNTMENLIVLCSSCHARRHWEQGDAQIGQQHAA